MGHPRQGWPSGLLEQECDASYPSKGADNSIHNCYSDSGVRTPQGDRGMSLEREESGEGGVWTVKSLEREESD